MNRAIFKQFFQSNEIIYIVFCLLLVILSFTIEIGHIDFIKAYYPVGRWILETGTFPYTYGGMKNLPLVGWLLAPFALFEIQTARWVFLVFELMCYLGAFIVFCEFLAVSYRNRWLALFLFITSRPFYIACFFGQLTFLAFFLFLLMVVMYLKGKKTGTGILFTSVFLIKIPPGLLQLYFLRKKEYKIVIVSILSYIAFLTASLVVFGWDLHVSWFQYVILLNVGTTLPAYNNQTFSSVLYRYLAEFNSYDWYPAALHPLLHTLCLLAIGGTIIWLLKKMTANQHHRELLFLELSIVICLFLNAFPLVWDHYYMFLIFSYFVLIQHLLKKGTPLLWTLTGLSFIMSNPPVEIFFNPQTHFRLLNVTLMSSPFFGNVLLTILLEKFRRATASVPFTEPEIPVAGGQ